MTQNVLPLYKNCHAMENKFRRQLFSNQFARLLCRVTSIFRKSHTLHPTHLSTMGCMWQCSIKYHILYAAENLYWSILMRYLIKCQIPYATPHPQKNRSIRLPIVATIAGQ